MPTWRHHYEQMKLSMYILWLLLCQFFRALSLAWLYGRHNCFPLNDQTIAGPHEPGQVDSQCIAFSSDYKGPFVLESPAWARKFIYGAPHSCANREIAQAKLAQIWSELRKVVNCVRNYTSFACASNSAISRFSQESETPEINVLAQLKGWRCQMEWWEECTCNYFHWSRW